MTSRGWWGTALPGIELPNDTPEIVPDAIEPRVVLGDLRRREHDVAIRAAADRDRAGAEPGPQSA